MSETRLTEAQYDAITEAAAQCACVCTSLIAPTGNVKRLLHG